MSKTPLEMLDEQDREEAARIEIEMYPLLNSVATRGGSIRDPVARKTLEKCQKYISKMLHGKMIGITVD